MEYSGSSSSDYDNTEYSGASSSDPGIPDEKKPHRHDIYTLLSKTDFSKDSSCKTYLEGVKGYYKSIAFGNQLIWSLDRYFHIIAHINLKYPGHFLLGLVGSSNGT
jgi:hypothetical protein